MSKDFNPIVVRALMRTPVSIVDPVHLEGILYDVRFRRDPTTMGTPLDCIAYDRGIPRVSAGIVVDEGIEGIASGTTTAVRSVNFRSGPAQGIDTTTNVSIGQMSPYRPRLTEHPILIGVSEILFQAWGDPDRILRMLEDSSGIGKLRQRGYGEVAEWSAEPCDAPEETCGWTGGGRVLRRLPVEFATAGLAAIPDDVAVGPGKLEPPYWSDQDEVDIAAPTLGSMTMTMDEARTAFSFE